MCFHGLTSGESPSNKRDVAALVTQTISQEVSQLVIAGEVNDGGRHSHNPARKHTHTHHRVNNPYESFFLNVYAFMGVFKKACAFILKVSIKTQVTKWF